MSIVAEVDFGTLGIRVSIFDYQKARRLYFAMGRKDAKAIEKGKVLPALRRIAAQARESS